LIFMSILLNLGRTCPIVTRLSASRAGTLT
jgi:hypothetical protein